MLTYSKDSEAGERHRFGGLSSFFLKDFNFFFCFSFSGERNKTLWPDCGWPFPRGWHSCHPVLPFASTVPVTEVLCLFSPRWAAEVGVGSGGLVTGRGRVAGCDILMNNKRKSALRSM